MEILEFIIHPRGVSQASVERRDLVRPCFETTGADGETLNTEQCSGPMLGYYQNCDDGGKSGAFGVFCSNACIHILSNGPQCLYYLEALSKDNRTNTCL